MCYYCQRYGHLEANCTAKLNKEDPYCHKCAGSHRSKDCNSDNMKCINCIRFKKSEVDHMATRRCCPILELEIERIKTITDHGY